MATSTTRMGIRRVVGSDLFKPYTVDLPSIVDTIDLKAVQFRSALASVQVRDVGEVSQIRAGRVLAPADFTAMGLTTPLGLWNLSNVNDSSGAARTLTNKGTVPFGPGIMGAATEAAIFAGSTGQALYIADTGGADPFRIKTGSFGCWFRTAKRGVQQIPMSKWTTSGQFAWLIQITTANVIGAIISTTGTDTFTPQGTSDVVDDRWHHVVVTHDSTRLRIYLDGALEVFTSAGLPIFGGSGPLNIGGHSADGSTAATSPHYGRVDEAFVTSDVLSSEQVLNLYCARVAHTMTDGTGAAAAPNGARIGWRRRRRGGVLATTDFPSTPVRLHNFTAGALTDAGSGGVSLVTNVGSGVQTPAAGADGVRDGAYSFSGAHTGLSSTDTGLPATTTSRTYGCWFKCVGGISGTLVGWGTTGTADTRLLISAGSIQTNNGADAVNGPRADDGLWHFGVVVEDNAAADAVKRKLYMDGRLVTGSTVLNTLTLAGANRFRVGAAPDGTGPFVGQTDGAFVFAGVLTPEQVHVLYNVGAQALAASPKAEGDHVEAMEASGVLVHFDTLEGCDLVDMVVTG